MLVDFNVMVKDEGLLLEKVLPIWKSYDVDQFVFYDDNSSDNTLEVIAKHLEPERYVLLNDKLPKFNEGYHRSKMLQHSRKRKADFAISVDSDELLSANFAKDLKHILKDHEAKDLWIYWYNVVNGSLEYVRTDPAYTNNYRNFVMPLKHTGYLDISQWKYHTPRIPTINLPRAFTKEYGIIHLQAMNVRFYALKQLWYKHYELVNYNHSISEINNRYDPVVNNLNFFPVKVPESIVGDLVFDDSVFDLIEEKKGYKKYVREHYNSSLVTFGKQYVAKEG